MRALTENTTPMAYSKRKNTFQSILFSPGMAIVLLFLVVFVGFGVVSIAEKSIDASRQRRIAQAEEASLAQKNDAMTKELAALDTPEGQEAALRDQFPIVKPGEHVVVITDPNADAASDVPVEQTPAPTGGFWNFIKSFL